MTYLTVIVSSSKQCAYSSTSAQCIQDYDLYGCFLLQKRECDAAKGKFGGTGYGYISFKKGDEQDLKRAVANLGPISVAFSALDDLYDYKSGEFIRLLLLEST